MSKRSPIHFTTEQLAANAAAADEWERVTAVVNGCRYTFTRRVSK